jgi:zinc and cadmium transporter
MDLNLLNVLGLAFLGSIAGLIGGFVFLLQKDWARTLGRYAVPFAAGVLLSVSILHLLPEAASEYGEKTYLVVLLALIGSFLFEQFFAQLHHHEHRKGTLLKATIPLVVVGDTIHNFIDGVAIAASYLISPSFGLVVAFATFLHETPHEIGDFGILMSRGLSKGKTFLINFFSAMATFPGALMVYYFLPDAHEKIGFLLAISAGVFLFLGASDFLPEVGEKEGRSVVFKEIALLILGVLIMYLLAAVTPAAH